MAQVFRLNGIVFDAITRADWTDSPGDQGLDGSRPLRRWRRHTWRAPEGMTAADFDALHGREGEKVNLTTTNYSDRNGDYKTYYGADLERVDGRHDGPVVTGVTIEFLVRI